MGKVVIVVLYQVWRFNSRDETQTRWVIYWRAVDEIVRVHVILLKENEWEKFGTAEKISFYFED